MGNFQDKAFALMRISPRLEKTKIDVNWRHLHDSGKSRPPISQYFSDTTGNHGSHTNLVLAMPCLPQFNTADHLGHYMA